MEQKNKTQTPKFDYKTKNLLDLQYHTYLNHFNIFAITALGIIFTVIWAHLTGQIDAGLRNSTILLTILFFGFLIVFTQSRMNQVITVIKAL